MNGIGAVYSVNDVGVCVGVGVCVDAAVGVCVGAGVDGGSTVGVCVIVGVGVGVGAGVGVGVVAGVGVGVVAGVGVGVVAGVGMVLAVVDLVKSPPVLESSWISVMNATTVGNRQKMLLIRAL